MPTNSAGKCIHKNMVQLVELHHIFISDSYVFYFTSSNVMLAYNQCAVIYMLQIWT